MGPIHQRCFSMARVQTAETLLALSTEHWAYRCIWNGSVVQWMTCIVEKTRFWTSNTLQKPIFLTIFYISRWFQTIIVGANIETNDRMAFVSWTFGNFLTGVRYVNECSAVGTHQAHERLKWFLWNSVESMFLYFTWAGLWVNKWSILTE